jgi:predicted HAD superfamily Cof-like phosphohydrolase
MKLIGAQQDVRDFHEKFGLSTASWPLVPDRPVQLLRVQLIAEEAKELNEALETGNLAEIAKESADLLYVVLGTLVSYGIDLEPVWQAVHASNMAKTGGVKSASGKVLKPPGWQKPDIMALIADQSRRPDLNPQ